MTISTRPALITIVDDPAPGTVSDFFDKSRCAELHTDGRRCQLVRGHDGQHVLRRGDVNVAWPDHADPARPAAVGRDLSAGRGLDAASKNPPHRSSGGGAPLIGCNDSDPPGAIAVGVVPTDGRPGERNPLPSAPVGFTPSQPAGTFATVDDLAPDTLRDTYRCVRWTRTRWLERQDVRLYLT